MQNSRGNDKSSVPTGELSSVGIREFGEWCNAAGMPESVALLKLTGGDHAAAFFLQSALMWGESVAVKNAEGWFYRKAKDLASDLSLTRHTLDRARKCLKMRVGMQESLRHPRLPSGARLLECVTHYRVDPESFRAAFDFYCLGAISEAQFRAVLTSRMLGNDNAGLPENDNAGLPENDNAGLPENDNAGLPENDSYESNNQDSKSNSERSSESSLLSPGRDDCESNHPGKADLPEFLHALYDRLGTPNGSTAEVLSLCESLGVERASEVAARCEDVAARWSYVLTAMRNELNRPVVKSRKNRDEPESAVGKWADFFKR